MGTGRGFGATGGKGQVMDGEKEKAAKEEARRRTLTDFRIVGLEIKGLGWSWGTVRGDLEEDEAVDETGETGETGEVDETTGKEEIKLENEEEVQVKKESNESEGSNQTSIPIDPVTQTQDPIKPELEPSSTESKPLDAESSTEEKQEQSSVTDTTVQVAGAGAGVIETKRGEKRKAKQSSPDAGLFHSLLSRGHRLGERCRQIQVFDVLFFFLFFLFFWSFCFFSLLD
jgi:20S proteasome subunit alpha 6